MYYKNQFSTSVYCNINLHYFLCNLANLQSGATMATSYSLLAPHRVRGCDPRGARIAVTLYCFQDKAHNCIPIAAPPRPILTTIRGSSRLVWKADGGTWEDYFYGVCMLSASQAQSSMWFPPPTQTPPTMIRWQVPTIFKS